MAVAKTAVKQTATSMREQVNQKMGSVTAVPIGTVTALAWLLS
jgi:hypothetical protein